MQLWTTTKKQHMDSIGIKKFTLSWVRSSDYNLSVALMPWVQDFSFSKALRSGGDS